MKKTFLILTSLLLVLSPLFSRDFTAVDKAVLSLPASAQTSPEKLIHALDEIADTYWEKTRAIWIWITHNITYDTDSYFSGRPGPTDAEGTFKACSSVCNGYAELFVLLAEGLKLEAVKISGYGKGYSYNEGTIPDGTNHAWNAIRIEGKWHLFDSTWGAGHLRGRNFEWAYEEFFFDTPPEKMIFSHFPEDSDFQLMKRPVTRKLFFNLPNMKGLAGRYDMNFKSALIEARSGKKPSFPLLYKCDHIVYLKNIPLRKTLKAGITYTFKIESPSTRLMISNGAGNPEIIKSINGVFSVKRKFKKGKLIFYIGHPDEKNTHYSGIMLYDIY